jgi:inosine-uridine nucleoside N-ribohydrolase
MNLWIDADPSGLIWTGLDCDDDLAILAVLAQTLSSPSSRLVGLSICGGNAPLVHTWAGINKLWNYIDFESHSLKQYHDLKPIQGYGWQSMQVSRSWLRLLHQIAPDLVDSLDAKNAIMKAILGTTRIGSTMETKDSDEDLTIVTLGPPTNVARAIQQLDDDRLLNTQTHLQHVYMMGGELTKGRLDLNFLTDRAAARTIIEASNIPVTLIPIQLCAQVIVDKTFIKRFEDEYCSSTSQTGAGDPKEDDVILQPRALAVACAILPKMKQQVNLMPRFVNKAVATLLPDSKRWKASPNLNTGFIPWDVIAVLVVTHPHLFDNFEYHRVVLVGCSEGEPCDMSMDIIEDINKIDFPPARAGFYTYNHSGVVRIPHSIKNETLVLETIYELLGRIPAVDGGIRPPIMMMGFLSQLGGIFLLSAILFITIVWRRI